MTTAIYSKTSTQSAIQVNGVDAVVIDATGLISGIAPNTVTPSMLTLAAQPLGVGQTWQSVVGSRAIGTTYYNTTGRPIAVQAGITATAVGTQSLIINGTSLYGATAAVGGLSYSFGIVPAGGSYLINRDGGGTQGLNNWAELR